MILVRLAAALLAVGLLLGGCGDGEESDAGADGAPITRARLVDQGDAICAEAEERATAVSSELFDGQATGKDVQREIIERVLPVYEEMIDDVEALGVPEGDAEELDALLEAMRERVELLRESPGGFEESSAERDQYREMLASVKDYGFKRCYQ